MTSRVSGARTASAPASDRAAHIALIRGINVGAAKRVGMADVRAAFADCGFDDARTVLNSGNVIFRAGARLRGETSQRIEAALRARTGVSARVHLLSAADLDDIIRDNTLLRHMTDPSRLVVHFVFGRSPKQVALPDPEEIAPDVLHAGKRVVYQWAPNGQSGSRVPPAYWQSFGDQVTSRNWRTVLRLRELAAG
jgi:uncharacterized protein (DUF1697 family)